MTWRSPRIRELPSGSTGYAAVEHHFDAVYAALKAGTEVDADWAEAFLEAEAE